MQDITTGSIQRRNTHINNIICHSLEEIENKRYPLVQILDPESLEFIYKNLNSYSDQYIHKDLEHLDRENFFVYKDLFEKQYSRAIVALKNHILNKELIDSIHGVLHARRVAFLNWLIIQRFSDLIQYQDTLVLSGFFHDLHRSNDNADTGHGLIVSEYISQNKSHIEADFQVSFDKDILIFLCKNHDENYPLDITSPKSILLHILKLADSLDRIRQPKLKWWPDFTKNDIQPTEIEIEMSIASFLSDYEK